MVTMPRSKPSYCLFLGVCICILASSFFRSGLTHSGHYRLSKATTFGLNKLLSKKMPNAFFSSEVHFFTQFCHTLFPHCQIPVHNQLFFQHLCSSCMIGQSPSQRCLDPSFIQKAFSEFASFPKMCRRL